MSRLIGIMISLLLIGVLAPEAHEAHAAAARAVTVTYYLSDAQGTVVAEQDAQGHTLARRIHRPYGTLAQGTPQAGPGYTGHVMDPDSELVYMQQRYYDPTIGRFISPDPIGPSPGNVFNFGRYTYANDNPVVNTDPDGRNATAFIGGLFVETGHFLTGHGFNGAAVVGALKDGYNGEGEGRLNAALQDAGTLSILAGGAGALRAAGEVAVRQTGERVVARLAKNAIKDDVKGSVRQIVRNGGEKQFRRDAASSLKGADMKVYETSRGAVKVGTHSDGSTVSVRSFSSSNRPTIEIKQPKVEIRTKVRYEDRL